MISVTNFYDITWCCVYIAGLAESTQTFYTKKKTKQKNIFLTPVIISDTQAKP